MALKVELPKELLTHALDQAIALRERYIKAASNPVIKQAYEQELKALEQAKHSAETIRDK